MLCIIYIPPENTRYSSKHPFNEIQIELDSLDSNFGHFLLFGELYAALVGCWLVVLCLTALRDSISVYIGPSPREREKEK